MHLNIICDTIQVASPKPAYEMGYAGSPALVEFTYTIIQSSCMIIINKQEIVFRIEKKKNSLWQHHNENV